MAVKRTFDTRRKGHESKNPKAVILIASEGCNKTEKTYFTALSRKGKSFVVRFASGNETDPVKMLQRLQRDCKKLGLKHASGDRAFVVLDLDCDANKARIINNLFPTLNHEAFIVSNPCFEVWFLAHFSSSTREFIDSKSVIQALKHHIPNYTKNLDVSDDLDSLMESALQNEQVIESCQDHDGKRWVSTECNPRTDVPTIIHLLTS